LEPKAEEYGSDISLSMIGHIMFWKMEDGPGDPGVPAALAGTVYIVWYLRALGATIGKNCSIWAGGQVGIDDRT